MLRHMGARIDLAVDRFGFYPQGGGRLTATVDDLKHWQSFELLERGAIRNDGTLGRCPGTDPALARTPVAVGFRLRAIRSRDLPFDADLSHQLHTELLRARNRLSDALRLATAEARASL